MKKEKKIVVAVKTAKTPVQGTLSNNWPEGDANTLMEAHKIKQDKKRHAAAISAASVLANEHKEKAAGLKKIAVKKVKI